ncbi:DUF2244 domain-containing protein [Alphaproteobacteria bacterium]|nr:DUF2244 domain-containing protein [Alphaproteobacteria bacterium]MDB3974200.1 DUF2244 domain-containing protein [Alphaproteobacteria bacterium]
MKRQIDIKPNKSLNQKQIILFLIITGGLIFFIGVRFVIVGAWPILIFGIIEFLILVFCTYLYVNFTKRKERIILDHQEMKIQKLDDKEIVSDQSYNLYWSNIKNNRDNLTLNYAGQKKIFAKFLNPQRRLKLKKIIERYKSRLS